jgi:hypothetical protein
MIWAVAVLMASTWIYVDRPVCSIQFVLETDGNCVIAPEIETKSLSSNRQPDGLHVLIFGLNQATITGRIAICSGPVARITDVTAANPDGTDAHARAKKVSGPLGLVARPRP